jgi:hypothetical protein
MAFRPNDASEENPVNTSHKSGDLNGFELFARQEIQNAALYGKRSKNRSEISYDWS